MEGVRVVRTRADEVVAGTGPDDDGQARGADPRVDHADEDAAARPEGFRLVEPVRALENAAVVMAEVGDAEFRASE